MIDQFNNLISRNRHRSLPQPYELKPNKTYLFAFDEDMWDVYEITQWFNKLTELIPDNINIALLPKSTIIKEDN